LRALALGERGDRRGALLEVRGEPRIDARREVVDGALQRVGGVCGIATMAGVKRGGELRELALEAAGLIAGKQTLAPTATGDEERRS
jgi:hypothetical protein